MVSADREGVGLRRAALVGAGIILIALPTIRAVSLLEPVTSGSLFPRPSPQIAPSPAHELASETREALREVKELREDVEALDEVLGERIYASPSPSETVSATAYCLTGTMANGEPAYDGAVASNLWPLGTELYVHELERTFTVADRVGHSSELDVAMPGRCGEAVAFGRRSLTVTIL